MDIGPPIAVLRPRALQGSGAIFSPSWSGCDTRPAFAPILASKLPLSEDAQGAWETIVIDLSSKQARARCHQALVAGLRLIRPEERVTAIAAALQEVEAREKQLNATVAMQ
jgi:hypothetical protein